jgi:hypothetical protein
MYPSPLPEKDDFLTSTHVHAFAFADNFLKFHVNPSTDKGAYITDY